MFESTTLFFGNNPAESLVCSSRAEAELLAAIARTGLRGSVPVPDTEEKCRELLPKFEAHLTRARKRFAELAAERAGTEKMRQGIEDILWHWFVHGRPNSGPRPANPGRGVQNAGT